MNHVILKNESCYSKKGVYQRNEFDNKNNNYDKIFLDPMFSKKIAHDMEFVYDDQKLMSYFKFFHHIFKNELVDQTYLDEYIAGVFQADGPRLLYQLYMLHYLFEKNFDFDQIIINNKKIFARLQRKDFWHSLFFLDCFDYGDKMRLEIFFDSYLSKEQLMEIIKKILATNQIIDIATWTIIAEEALRALFARFNYININVNKRFDHRDLILFNLFDEIVKIVSDTIYFDTFVVGAKLFVETSPRTWSKEQFLACVNSHPEWHSFFDNIYESIGRNKKLFQKVKDDNYFMHYHCFNAIETFYQMRHLEKSFYKSYIYPYCGLINKFLVCFVLFLLYKYRTKIMTHLQKNILNKCVTM